MSRALFRAARNLLNSSGICHGSIKERSRARGRLLRASRIHTSSSRRAVWFMGPLSRFVVAVGARVARTLWRRLPAERKGAIKAGVGSKWKYVAAGSGCCVVLYYATHLEEAPITRRRRFMMYSRSDVRQMLVSEGEQNSSGDYIYGIIGTDSVVLPSNHPDYVLVRTIVADIINSNQSWMSQVTEDVKWRLAVIDNDNVNAVSLPTGDIIVNTGMVRACKNKNELGFILSHEMAHVILAHGVETLSHTGLVSFLALFFIAAFWFFIPSDLLAYFTHQLFNGATALLLKNPYSRKLELEADQIGLMLLSRACYDPEESIKLWQHIPTLNKDDDVLEYLGTHPSNIRRYSSLSTYLPTALELYSNSQCKEMTGFTKLLHKIVGFNNNK